ncbi:MAG TPA: hypothetical protein VNC78_03930 [Actinomycetota bacterium]|nr:hypothetical protein [Actinomycetota bacterium]
MRVVAAFVVGFLVAPSGPIHLQEDPAHQARALHKKERRDKGGRRGPERAPAVPPVIAAAPVVAPQRGAAVVTDDMRVEAYRGLGSWVDWVDLAPWAHPVATVRGMHERGVQTLFLQTSTYGLDVALKEPLAMGLFIEEAHRLGMNVVAWYVPSFAHMKVDLARVKAALDFRTPKGETFDSFALDIEATHVDDIATRNKRLIRMSEKIRAYTGPDYSLGAITPDPVASRYWPNFPYRELTKTYDVFVPMGYFTFRARGFNNVKAYTAAGIRMIRKASGDPNFPIHAIGGIAGDTEPRDVRGFVSAVRASRVLGGSFYDYPITNDEEWAALAPLSRR